MRRFGLQTAATLGLVTALASGQAYAAPTCTTTLTAATPAGSSFTVGGGAGQLGPGVCVQAADKLFGNFAFGTPTPATGGSATSVVFSWSAPIGGTHTIAFNDNYNGVPAGATVANIGYEVTVASATITSLVQDFLQSTPTTSTLSGSSNPAGSGAILLSKLDGTVNAGSTNTINYALPGVSDLTVTHTLTLGVNASVSAVQDTLTEQVNVTTTPEPGSLALVGAALVGFGLLRRRRKAA